MQKKVLDRIVLLVKNHGIYFFILTVLVFASYVNSLTNNFVSDDLPAIPGNPNFKSIGYIFSNPTFFARSIPYYFAYKIGGYNPLFFRLINVMFHLGNVWLIYLLFYFLSKSSIAFLTAALFAVHPLLIESVTWISGGVYSQYTFFLLLSFFLYIRFKHRWYLYVLSLISFLLALSTSEKAAVMPIILVVYEFSNGNLKKHWKNLIPYFLLVVGWIALIFSLRLRQRVTYLDSQFHLQTGLDNPLYQIPIAVVSYFQLIFWPIQLAFYHSELRFTFLQYLIYLFFFITYLCLIVFAYFKNKKIFFWLVFFIITLLPTLTPFKISWIIAERYAYLGSIGFFFTFSYVLLTLVKKDWYKKSAVVLAILLVGILAVRTFLRNIDWKNEDNLWVATSKSSPSSPVTHNNMADVYTRHGDLKNAEKELKIAIGMNNSYADAYHNLGAIYRDTKRTDLALEMFQKSVDLNPALWQGYMNLSAIYFNQKDYKKALEYMEKAVKVAPYNYVLHRNLGIVYYNLDQKDKALAEFYKALDLSPEDQLTKAWIGEVSK